MIMGVLEGLDEAHLLVQGMLDNVCATKKLNEIIEQIQEKASRNESKETLLLVKDVLQTLRSYNLGEYQKINKAHSIVTERLFIEEQRDADTSNLIENRRDTNYFTVAADNGRLCIDIDQDYELCVPSIFEIEQTLTTMGDDTKDIKKFKDGDIAYVNTDAPIAKILGTNDELKVYSIDFPSRSTNLVVGSNGVILPRRLSEHIGYKYAMKPVWCFWQQQRNFSDKNRIEWTVDHSLYSVHANEIHTL